MCDGIFTQSFWSNRLSAHIMKFKKNCIKFHFYHVFDYNIKR